MTSHKQTLGEDIAFLRALAEEGRSRPLIGGSILLGSGVLYGTASLLVWAVSTYGFTNSGTVSLIWLAALIGSIIQLAFTRSTWARGVESAASRASGLAWAGASWAIFVVVFSMILVAARTGDLLVVATLPSIALAFYGSAWFVAAALTRSGWLFGVAFGAFLMALVSGWFVAEGAIVYLIYAISLYALAAAPGFVLMRRARRAA
jgi:hypothetical protein